MTARSALCPRIVAVTTWWSSAWVDLIAAMIASRSASGVGLQNRCNTPHPADSVSGSAIESVEVHLAVAGKPGERQAGGVRGLDREARGRAHGDDRGEARRPGLLHDLEARSTADVQRELRRRKPIVEQQTPHDLVDGVVAADVFAQHDDLTVARECGGGVDRAGGVEQPL